MTPIDAFTWFVLLVIIGSVVAVFVVLGMLPAKIANERGHPQSQAIAIASWLALIFGFAAWPFVLVWAYLRPVAKPLDDPEDKAVRQRIETLEARIAELESGTGGGAVQ